MGGVNTFDFLLSFRYIKVTAVLQQSVQSGFAGFSSLGSQRSMQGSDPAGGPRVAPPFLDFVRLNIDLGSLLNISLDRCAVAKVNVQCNCAQQFKSAFSLFWFQCFQHIRPLSLLSLCLLEHLLLHITQLVPLDL